MEGAGHDARPHGDDMIAVAPIARPEGALQPSLTRATNFLEDNVCIGTYFHHHRRYRRYVDLRRRQMFEALTELYSLVFTTFWGHLRRFVETFVPTGYIPSPQHFAARAYITGWFHDLYVSNRIACRKLSDAAYGEQYHLDIVHKSLRYDLYLCALSAQIRPTNIKLTHEDTLFIPRFRQTIDVNAADEDYFHIPGWNMNTALLNGLIQILEDRRLLKFDVIPETALGRPGWLFDWHDDHLSYAWFPSETNYTFQDVSVAYVLGEACSPKLAPRDRDEWQIFPGNITPAIVHADDYDRIIPISYFAAITVRVIETRSYQLPDSYKSLIRARQPGAPSQPATPQPQAATRHTTTATRRRTSKALVIATRSSKRVGKRPLDPSATEEAPRSEDSAPESPNGPADSVAETPTEPQAPGDQVDSQPPAPVQTTTAQTGTILITTPTMQQYRLIDYLYHARVVNNINFSSRLAALKCICYYQQ